MDRFDCAILAELDKRKVPVVVMGMLAAPNIGRDYAREFDAVAAVRAAKRVPAIPARDRPGRSGASRSRASATTYSSWRSCTTRMIAVAYHGNGRSTLPSAPARRRMRTNARFPSEGPQR